MELNQNNFMNLNFNIFLQIMFAKCIYRGNTTKSLLIISNMLYLLKKSSTLQSDLVLQTAIFNILIPVKIQKKNFLIRNTNQFKGIPLNLAVNNAINSIFHTIKLNRQNSLAHKLVKEVKNLYNKQGNLYFLKLKELQLK